MFFDDFDRIFELGFGKPRRIVFNTNSIKDMNPAIWSKTEDGNYTAVIKTLGVEKVQVIIEDYGIKVFGENELKNKHYDTTIELPIAQDVMDNVVEIRHETIAGLTFVDLIIDRPERKQIKIVALDNKGSFENIVDK